MIPDEALVSRVMTIVETVAQEEIVPRFRRLSAGDVQEKGPGDYVTVADKRTEERLMAALTDLIPGSSVVGEEGVADDPGRRSALAEGGPVWIIDPVDGTRNFVNGIADFCSMVALAVDGRVVGGWIVDPINGRWARAAAGAGTRVADRPVEIASAAPDLASARGRFNLPSSGRNARSAKALSTVIAERRALRCSGSTYLDLVDGSVDLAVFRSGKVWDHAPGHLMVLEAGGASGPLDGSAYRIADEPGTMVAARSPALWRDTARIVVEAG